MNKINASTMLYGVFGYPAKHSLSPILHNFWLDEFNINAVYLAFECEPHNFETSINGLHKSGLMGANITSPMKEAAAKIAIEKSHEVGIIGAANTLKSVNKNGFSAFSTDGKGLVIDLDFKQKGWRENTKKITIIGAGGAARSIIKSLAFEGMSEISFIGRSIEKCQELVKIGQELCDINPPTFSAYSWEEMPKAINNSDLIINATTLGLKGVGALEIDLIGASKNAIIYDMVYMPCETAFIKSAKQQGKIAYNGLGMLVGQASVAFEIWHEIFPDFQSGLKLLEQAINV